MWKSSFVLTFTLEARNSVILPFITWKAGAREDEFSLYYWDDRDWTCRYPWGVGSKS
jgi:hypothetical protein